MAFSQQWLSPPSSSGALTTTQMSTQIDQATGQNGTVALDSYAAYSYTLNGLYGLETASGSIVVTVQIDGVNVTGLTNITVNTVKQNAPATGNNTVSPGSRVTIIYSSNSSAVGLEGSLQAQATGATPGKSGVMAFQIDQATGQNGTIALDSSAAFPYTITGFMGVQLAGGSENVQLQINGTPVTFTGGITTITPTTTPTNYYATANNIVSQGNRVTVVYSSNSNATSVEGSLQATV